MSGLGGERVGFPREVEQQGPGKGHESEQKVMGSLGEREATRHRAMRKGAL